MSQLHLHVNVIFQWPGALEEEGTCHMDAHRQGFFPVD